MARSCKVVPGNVTVFEVPGNDIVITNVSLGSKLYGDARSTLLIHHRIHDLQRSDDNYITTEAALACLTPGKASDYHPFCPLLSHRFAKVEFAAIHLILNRGEKIGFEVEGDK